MDTNTITAFAAVMGSLVGALASFASSWLTQRYQSRRDHVGRQIARREVLYSEFITEAARLYSDALMRSMDDPQAMVSIWALLGRIRLAASEPVLEAAEAVTKLIAAQYVSANLAAERIQDLSFMLKGDPLQGFGEACRHELETIQNAG